ncbi:Immunoglobulin G-binding protein A precursor [Maioricimonas rarisocia]|uniref:Immunoglobulin G-binding protein A n=1 Tax=Maioricimonas rarisocia TaxID=2528026 RepID=A0A517ZD47_9PLAN|nr:hypothetical protein [Maioricimonas rarisocia]QDU40387.1 Immunoglobulin G-binding protein A precursor [Maioricimonas rarisocia]
MTDPRLTRELHPVLRRVRKVRWLKSLALGWLILAALGGLMLWLPPGLPVGWMFVALGVLIAITVAAVAWPRSSDRSIAARLIEEQYPDLDSRLLTAVEQQPDFETGRYHFLQREVVSDVLVHARRRKWGDSVPGSRLFALRAANVASVLMALFVAMLLFSDSRHRSAEPLVDGQPGAAEATTGYEVTVEPGDTEIERGTSLLVLARFASKLPANVDLVAKDESGAVERVPLSKSLDLSDPLFGGRLSEVASDLTYHVEFDGEQSDAFRVTTFEYPRLIQADAQIVQPTYTGLPDKTYKDVRRISLVEGSELTLTCHLNKPVQQATLISDSGTAVPLEVGDDGVVSDRTATFRPVESVVYQLVLIDEAGRENRDPPEITIDVVPNRAPELTVAFPGRDTQVSPLQELTLQAKAWDDFGLKEYGLVLQTPTGDEQSLVLGSEAAPDENVELDHLMPLEDLSAEPKDLIAYYFYADDIGPNGDVRRTFSDMFFAEVRHFDEIYRQAPSQKASGTGGDPCKKLIQLQRQVVTATWNTMRRFPTDPDQSEQEPFSEDLDTLTESETTVLELTQQYQQTLEDLIARQFASEAVEHMITALEQYRLSRDSGTVPALAEARIAAQAAFAALLKLQAREHLVKNSQSSSQSSSSQAQRQLDDQLKQLELQNDRNRYETERQAQRESENREQLQVLNRLRELARRQEDVNQKIQELENALRKAETEEERRELERQLKRLQEEQQEMLRDVDELRERMNRDENRTQMADARRQLEQTRQNVLQTSEQLRDRQVSKALASGTRAQRELEELRDEIRKETASEFTETMRELRDEARELADRQEEIGDKLGGNEEKSRPSLRETTGNTDLAEQLNEQKERLTGLLDEMRDIVEQSEESEPLLSRKLYDTIRESRGDRPVESLEMASELLRRGFPEEGRQAEQVARGAIDRIREGVEEAADSVLGDELESLQRAQDELAMLTQSIEEELTRSDPEFKRQQPRNPQEQQPRNPQEQQPGNQQGQQPGNQQGQQPGNQQGQQRGNQQGQQPGNQQGQQPGNQQGQQPGNQQGQQPGNQQGQRPGNQQGQQPGQSPSGRGNRSPSQSSRSIASAFDGGSQTGGGHAGPHMPLTGGEFMDWSDRMRDVEEMLTDPDLRSAVARVRDRAREVRIDVKRHSKQPNWKLVRTSIYGELVELQEMVAEEIARQQPENDLVPIDRDPVPDRYSELVRTYYERLGRQRP